jgi:hypothetical protein
MSLYLRNQHHQTEIGVPAGPVTAFRADMIWRRLCGVRYGCPCGAGRFGEQGPQEVTITPAEFTDGLLALPAKRRVIAHFSLDPDAVRLYDVLTPCADAEGRWHARLFSDLTREDAAAWLRTPAGLHDRMVWVGWRRRADVAGAIVHAGTTQNDGWIPLVMPPVGR